MFHCQGKVGHFSVSVDKVILAARQTVYERAKQRHPERWSGDIRNWEPVGEVWLNPNNREDPKPEIRDLAA